MRSNICFLVGASVLFVHLALPSAGAAPPSKAARSKKPATARQAPKQRTAEDVVKEFVQEKTGEPESIKWSAIRPIGPRYWIGKNLEDIEDMPRQPTPFYAVQVKYRAKNTRGVMQAYSYAVLLRDGAAITACPYPHKDLVAPNDRFTEDFLEMFR